MNTLTYLFGRTRRLECVRLDSRRALFLTSTIRAQKKKKSQPIYEDAELDHFAEGYVSGDPVLAKVPNDDEIHPLAKIVKLRREQACRTVLIAPDLRDAGNPCPRYMRHRVENLIGGKVRHVSLTSMVTSSKLSVDGVPVVSEPASRKSLLVEFQDADQMRMFTANNVSQFSTDQVTHSTRLIYHKNKWSQARTPATDPSLKERLNACPDLDTQLMELVAATELDDAGVRTRFFLCDVMEKMLTGIFPGCRIVPFGSTISNLGRSDSDMDVVMNIPSRTFESPFLFFSRRADESEQLDARATQARQLRIISDVIRAGLPGVVDLNRILRARIPIVTFRHTHTNICCDMSTQTGGDALLAAQLFYAYTRFDPNVRPYLFALRRWAIGQGLSSFLTNFPLTCLGLFHLMMEGAVPPMNRVLKKNRMGVVDSIHSGLRWSSTIHSTAEDLLHGFFRFFSQFDFERNAISVFDGVVAEKKTIDIIEVENPLDRDLNCAKLISQQSGLLPMVRAMELTHQALENRGKRSENGDDWGLTLLLETNHEDAEKDSDSETPTPRPEEVQLLLNDIFVEKDTLNQDHSLDA